MHRGNKEKEGCATLPSLALEVSNKEGVRGRLSSLRIQAKFGLHLFERELTVDLTDKVFKIGEARGDKGASNGEEEEYRCRKSQEET